MAEIKRDLLAHFKQVNQLVTELNGSALLDIKTFQVRIDSNGKKCHLYPQFITLLDDEKVYVSELDEASLRFIGWRPYGVRQVPLFQDKIRFKKHLSAHAFLTPAYSEEQECSLSDVLIKNKVGSFSRGIEGPFHEIAKESVTLRDGQYFEKFVVGKSIKIWFWNEIPICGEFVKMPYVIGNGRESVEALIHRFFHKDGYLESLSRVVQVLAHFGTSPSYVPKEGEKCIVDFVYGSPFMNRKKIVNKMVLDFVDSNLRSVIETLGTVLWKEIRSEGLDKLVYTVDAVLDSDRKVWILEANANPYVHPWVYPFMIDTFLYEQGSCQTVKETYAP